MFIEAGKISHEYKLYNAGLGLTDAYLLAVAIKNDSALWSLDKQMNKAFDSIESK